MWVSSALEVICESQIELCMQLGFGELKFAWVDAYQGGSALNFLKCRFSL